MTTAEYYAAIRAEQEAAPAGWQSRNVRNPRRVLNTATVTQLRPHLFTGTAGK